jgi:alkylated DNA nucleotide flippase Atl1
MASGEDLPWWRVVTSQGRLVPGHEAEQARRLSREGVQVRGRHVAAFRAQRGRGRPRGTMP